MVAVAVFGIMTALSAAVAAAAGLPVSDAVVVGGCLGLSSTPVALGNIPAAADREAAHGRLILGVLVVQVRAAAAAVAGAAGAAAAVGQPDTV
eukprot:SAG22_NODE_3283_length_1805_cov_11.877101_1_plen_93_part_00